MNGEFVSFAGFEEIFGRVLFTAGIKGSGPAPLVRISSEEFGFVFQHLDWRGSSGVEVSGSLNRGPWCNSSRPDLVLCAPTDRRLGI